MLPELLIHHVGKVCGENIFPGLRPNLVELLMHLVLVLAQHKLHEELVLAQHKGRSTADSGVQASASLRQTCHRGKWHSCQELLEQVGVGQDGKKVIVLAVPHLSLQHSLRIHLLVFHILNSLASRQRSHQDRGIGSGLRGCNRD